MSAGGLFSKKRLPRRREKKLPLLLWRPSSEREISDILLKFEAFCERGKRGRERERERGREKETCFSKNIPLYAEQKERQRKTFIRLSAQKKVAAKLRFESFGTYVRLGFRQVNCFPFSLPKRVSPWQV